MTLGRFLILFAIGIGAALVLRLTWRYWLLCLSAGCVLFKLIKG